MYRVSTFDFCKTLESKVKEKEDDVLSCRVEDFSNLTALEAKYHSLCHKKYLKKSVPTSSASSPHDSAFDDLISKIKPELEDGTDFDMNQVFQFYQEFLGNYTSQEDAQKYTHQKLKIKLQTKTDFIVFHSAPQANKPDLISHVSLKMKDIINKAVDQKRKLKEILTAQSLSCDLSRVEPSEIGILFYASLIM